VSSLECGHFNIAETSPLCFILSDSLALIPLCPAQLFKSGTIPNVNWTESLMKRRHSGLGMPPLVLAGLLLAQLVSAAPVPNAWQIPDSLATGGALNYATNLFVRRSGQRHKLAGQPQRLVGGDRLQVHDV
jgi:hypothetical protein